MEQIFSEEIRIPKRNKPRPWNEQASIMDGPMYEYVTFSRQCWAFEGAVAGVPVLYKERTFAVAEGWRCSTCKKVLFVSEMTKLHHECTEPN